MLLAGGQGSRLGVLTAKVAKPAVAFGGKYRIIDFPLSNCINSGIDTVGVLTQYQPLRLNTHIGIGIPWDLDRNIGGVSILPPYEKSTSSQWYTGTANAIYQNLEYMETFNPDYVLILSGDHIYKMDYEVMLDFHKENHADVTIAAMPVPIEEASRFGIVITDEDKRITEFEEKPAQPKSNKASMGVYIFSWSKMRKYLELDEANPNSDNDFGKNIIPNMLAAGEKLKGECLGHLAYDDAPLVKPIVACEHLAAGNALGFRLIGFYIGYGDALTPVGVIYEQLRVNAEGLVQHVFTGVGDVSHGQYAEACEPCGCAAAYTPEIRYRAVIPQLLAVARLVKLADEIRSVL